MWGDRSSRVKLTGDFGNAIEGIRISNRLPLLVFAKNSWRCNFRLLQHYRHFSDMANAMTNVRFDGARVFVIEARFARPVPRSWTRAGP
jgi:hypothetical protein